jgi:hypothetical protein
MRQTYRGSMRMQSAVVFVLFSLTYIHAQSFTKHFIDDNLAWASGVATADVDGDLDVDVVATGATADEVDWYENDGVQNFVKHVVDGSLDQARSCYGVDLDLDTDIDIIAAASGADVIMWYENDGSQNFTSHIVSYLAGAWDVFAVDMDQDTDLDIVAVAADANVVNWYENDGSQNFTEHIVDTFLDGAEGLYVLDLDQDYDIDIIACGIFGDEVAWYENDSSQNFTEHTVDAVFDGANDVCVGDMDLDGDYDIVASGSMASQVRWYENDGFQNFTGHTVAGLQGARAVFVANLNGDSLPDIVAVGLQDMVMWYENTGGGTFVPYVIDNFLDLAFGLYVADVDGDGDLDVLATGGTANDLVWYESDLVGVAENDLPVPVVSEIANLHNRPNPFTTRTVFYFDMVRPSSFLLSVFNVSGQILMTMNEPAHSAGHIEIPWDRRDSQGRRVPAGIYFYTIETATSSVGGHMCVVD